MIAAFGGIWGLVGGFFDGDGPDSATPGASRSASVAPASPPTGPAAGDAPVEIPDDPAELVVPAPLRGTWTGTAYHTDKRTDRYALKITLTATKGKGATVGTYRHDVLDSDGTWCAGKLKLVGSQPEDLELEMERTSGTARALGGPSCAVHTEVHLRMLPDGRAAYTYGTHLGANFTATLARR
ncbi:hypothetical protein [Plantactinospora mayteni]|uniref:hypothetical protein n=1 Tax=Plantactinospora mayteni TaxID=566021 RepID=UPI001940CD79|nr:hypothetical protein [Plantactinospora mayteni]